MVAARFIGVFLICLFSIQKTLAISIHHGSSIDDQINEEKPIQYEGNVGPGVDSELIGNPEKPHFDNYDNDSKKATSSVFDETIDAGLNADFDDIFENDYLDFNYCSVEMPTPSTEYEAKNKIYYWQNSTDNTFNSDDKSLSNEHRVVDNVEATQRDIQLNDTLDMTVSGYTIDEGYSSVSIQKAAEVQALEYSVKEPSEDQNVIQQQNSSMKKEIFDIPLDEKKEDNLVEQSFMNVENKSESLKSLEESEIIIFFEDNHPMASGNRIIKKSNATEYFQQTDSSFENNTLESSTVRDTSSLESDKHSIDYITNHGNSGLEVDQTARILNSPNLNYSRNNQSIKTQNLEDEMENQSCFNGTKIFPQTDPVCEQYNKSEVFPAVDDFTLAYNKSSKDNTTFIGESDLAGDKTTEDPKHSDLKQESRHPKSLNNSRIAKTGNSGLEVDQTARILNSPNLNYSRNNQSIKTQNLEDEMENQSCFNGTKIFPQTDPVCEQYNKSEVFPAVDDFTLAYNKSSKDNTTFIGESDLAGDKTTEDPKHSDLKQESRHPKSLNNSRIAKTGNSGLEVDQTARILNSPNLNYSRNNQSIKTQNLEDEMENQSCFNGTKIFPQTDPVCEQYNKSEVFTAVDNFELAYNKSSKDNTTFFGGSDLASNKPTEDSKDFNLKQESRHPKSLNNSRIAKSGTSLEMDVMNFESNNCSIDNTTFHANIDSTENETIEVLKRPKIKQNEIEKVLNSNYKVNGKVNINEEKNQPHISKPEKKLQQNVTLTPGASAKINKTKNKKLLNITNVQTLKTNPMNGTKTDKDTNKTKPVPAKSEISQEKNEEQFDITTLLKIFTPEDVMSMMLNSRPKQENIPKQKVECPKHAIIKRDRLKQAIEIAKYTMEKYADLL